MRLIIFLLLTANLHGQTLSKKQIDAYVKSIDSLNSSKILRRYSYPEMSPCGGSLYGLYLNEKLAIIDAVYGGELGGYNSRKIYFKDTVILKIIYNVRRADFEKYAKKYPETEKIDPLKLTYTDTLYTIYLSREPAYAKSSRGKIITRRPDQVQIDDLLNCGYKMQAELASKKVLR